MRPIQIQYFFSVSTQPATQALLQRGAATAYRIKDQRLATGIVANQNRDLGVKFQPAKPHRSKPLDLDALQFHRGTPQHRRHLRNSRTSQDAIPFGDQPSKRRTSATFRAPVAPGSAAPLAPVTSAFAPYRVERVLFAVVYAGKGAGEALIR